MTYKLAVYGPKQKKSMTNYYCFILKFVSQRPALNAGGVQDFDRLRFRHLITHFSFASKNVNFENFGL